METAKEERARAKRDQIRAGARRVFLERGFMRASTNDIAAEAGVSKQTLYAYYASKEDLLVDVLRQIVMEGPRAPLQGLEDLEVGSEEELREVLVERLKGIAGIMMSAEYLALIRIVIAEVPQLPGLGDLFRSTIPEKGIKLFSELLERTNAQGVTAVPDSEVAARMLVGSIATYALLDGLLNPGNPRPLPDERIHAIVNTYMKTIT
ncbi:hypothetical protein RxyAA322_10400 [Rubrobacter xylanophilus]|uniref:HTH tetR-type domain-containing protein n=1 Tax=Rubrobacter xylanophilus TaxID=49319 RepID=A0A510HGS2_9ACTN|nr:TetR/AcrR family transcriptional regulator [Rubrobacter xylanophilus]BBL79186.1 hypothetical protein RxyAA322_10400 [Rubrobacter xylanophilus]